MSDLDDLDRRIRDGYRNLGRRVRTDEAIQAVDGLPRRPLRRRPTLAWLVAPAAAILIVAVVWSQPQRPPGQGAQTPSQSSQAATATGQTPPVSAQPGFDVASWVAQRPALLDGPLGATDTSAYGPTGPEKLSAEPIQDTGFAGEFGGSRPGNVLAIEGVEQLASLSRHVVRGRILAISRPYFNSADGSFWLPELVGANAGRAVSPMLLRDVIVDVDEVLAGSAPVADGRLVMTVPGGQAIVHVPRDQPYAEGYGDHVIAAGRYRWTDEPATDLAVGETAVFFLNDVALDGLYAGDGSRYGYVFRLMPAEELNYKFAVDGADVIASPTMGERRLTRQGLDDLLSSDNFASAAGPIPDGLVHDQAPEP